MQRTNIAWTECTWNPTRGCDKASPGCANCYAKALFEQRRGNRGYEAGFDLRLAVHKLVEPLASTTPATVFVNSTSDLFHKDVPTDYIRDVAKIMRDTPWHQYQVLTKRHQRMKHLLTGNLAWAATLPNVWWGVSVEDRAHGFPRIRHLQDIPGANRFLSVEPLLEDLGQLDLSGIGWVIVGGETGRGFRPMNLDWARSVRDQTVNAQIPFFFKQVGGASTRSCKTLDGVAWNEQPPRPYIPVASRQDRMALKQPYIKKHGLAGCPTKVVDPTAAAPVVPITIVPVVPALQTV